MQNAVVAMLVKCALNSKYITVSPAKHPHTIIPPPPCFTVGNTHAEIIRSPTPRLTKTRRLEPKIWTPDQRTHFYRSNVHCSCFLAQASLFFLLVSFSSGFFAAILPWRPDSCSLLWTVDVEMSLLLELRGFIWAAIWGAVNCPFLRLVMLMNLPSASGVILGLPFLWWSSWELASSWCLMFVRVHFWIFLTFI